MQKATLLILFLAFLSVGVSQPYDSDCVLDIYIEVPDGVYFDNVTVNSVGEVIDLTDLLSLPSSGFINSSRVSCSLNGTVCPSCCLDDEFNYGVCSSSGCIPKKCDCNEANCSSECPSKYGCISEECIRINRTIGQQCGENIQCLNNNCTESMCYDQCTADTPCRLGAHRDPGLPWVTDYSNCCIGASCFNDTDCDENSQLCFNGTCVQRIYVWGHTYQNNASLCMSEIEFPIGYCSQIEMIGSRYPKNCTDMPDCGDANLACDGTFCIYKSLDGQPCSFDDACFSSSCIDNVCQGDGTNVAQVLPLMTCEGTGDSNQTTCLGNPNFFCQNSSCVPKFNNGEVCTKSYQCDSGSCSTGNDLPGVCNSPLCIDIESPVVLFNGTTVKAKDVRVGDDLMGLDGERNTVMLIVGTGYNIQTMVGVNGGPKFFTPAHSFHNPKNSETPYHVYDPKAASDALLGLFPEFPQMVAGRSYLSEYEEETSSFADTLIQSLESETRNSSVVTFVTVSDSNLRSYVSHSFVTGESQPLPLPTCYMLINVIFGNFLYQFLPRAMELAKMIDPKFSEIGFFMEHGKSLTEMIQSFSVELQTELKEENLVGKNDYTVQWRETVREMARNGDDQKNDKVYSTNAAGLVLANVNTFQWMYEVDPQVIINRGSVKSLETRFIKWMAQTGASIAKDSVLLALHPSTWVKTIKSFL